MEPKQEKRIAYLTQSIVFLMVVLWIYTASSKLMDFHHFKAQMHNQTIPKSVADLLIYSLPVVEIAAATLLIFEKTKLTGLWLSAILLAIFTGYIGLVLLNFFGRTPCSCGGVLRIMNWPVHFVFNLFFLLSTILGTYLTDRERRLWKA